MEWACARVLAAGGALTDLDIDSRDATSLLGPDHLLRITIERDTRAKSTRTDFYTRQRGLDHHVFLLRGAHQGTHHHEIFASTSIRTHLRTPSRWRFEWALPSGWVSPLAQTNTHFPLPPPPLGTSQLPTHWLWTVPCLWTRRRARASSRDGPSPRRPTARRAQPSSSSSGVGRPDEDVCNRAQNGAVTGWERGGGEKRG